MTTLSKSQLRNLARNTLNRVPAEERKSRSAMLVHNLSQYIKSRFPNARHIASFSALPYEPDLSLLHNLLPDKQLCYPLVKDEEDMHFHLVTEPTTLKEGSFKILEPNPQVHPPVDPDVLDLILVPGLAFDLRGNRLGHGAGYYDRFLSLIPTIPTIGVTYGSQLLPEVPTEPHDHAMAYLASDRGVIPI
ncbi:5-formyltetrahydrofolate cyclo-ligase [Roseibacillus persicicus]|nr:5-formyltetrahydrofolate cyclo-ligase [Roseibacillus persicicus]